MLLSYNVEAIHELPLHTATHAFQLLMFSKN